MDAIVWLVVGVAAACAALGLLGVALRELPWAERMAGGRWIPGGPFEYAAPLALAQVAALPGAPLRDGPSTPADRVRRCLRRRDGRRRCSRSRPPAPRSRSPQR